MLAACRSEVSSTGESAAGTVASATFLAGGSIEELSRSVGLTHREVGRQTLEWPRSCRCGTLIVYPPLMRDIERDWRASASELTSPPRLDA
jgi:hypothetical protein